MNEGVLHRLLRRVVDVRREEVAAVMWSWLYFFAVLSAYYVVRPLRDEMGVAGGVRNLPWLFTGTLAGMTLANPPFAALVAKLAPVRFISITYRFFIGNLLVFLVLTTQTTGDVNVWVGRFFYIWAAIFNLFVVSVFWGFLADVFTNEQSHRLFGFIAAGGTLGGIAGSMFTSTMVERIGAGALLLVSAVMLEAAVFSVRRLARISQGLREKHGARGQPAAVGGRILSGFSHVVKSAYLLNLSLYMLLLAILYTVLYFQQAEIAGRSFPDRRSLTAFFANVDLTVNALTLGIQLLATGRIVRALGVTGTLTLLPVVTAAGFLWLGTTPTLWVLVVFQVFRRGLDFAVARPTREVLFTVVEREDKYKAKSFIDTFVYRAGDQIGAWGYALLGFLGLGVARISFVAVPIAVVSLVNAVWLGRREKVMRAPAAVGATQ